MAPASGVKSLTTGRAAEGEDPPQLSLFTARDSLLARAVISRGVQTSPSCAGVHGETTGS